MTGPLPPSTDEPLPGLGDPDPRRGASELEAQVRRSLAFMADRNLVDGRHAGLMQLALELARSIKPSERAYGNAQAAAQLLACFAQLMPDQEGASDGFDDFRAFLTGVDLGRGGTEVRDTEGH